MIEVFKKQHPSEEDNLVLLTICVENIQEYLNEQEFEYALKCQQTEQKQIAINQYHRWVFIQLINSTAPTYKEKEAGRKSGHFLHQKLKAHKLKSITIVEVDKLADIALTFVEGILLTNYQFLKYFQAGERENKKHALQQIHVVSQNMDNSSIQELKQLVQAVYHARTLVNEPVWFLNAPQYAQSIKELGEEAGFSVEIWDKTRIEAENMTGLLAVNRGSVDPPVFAIMEWKPKNARNERPLILVGKGVVYDTGGLSLKHYMDDMKCDMGGSATVVGTMYAVAKNNLPVHVIALVPSTDNRPGLNAYAPGDVITMHSGLMVEVLNTDAEGRMILADALSYAKRYNPMLVIDFATLTSAAARAVGKEAMVVMGTASRTDLDNIRKSGEEVYERIVEFPLWEEYKEQLKSSIADLKNIGGAEAGVITAGKFLEQFTSYPWIHFDIAGPSYVKQPFNYKGKGGTGIGIRLMYEFIKNHFCNPS